METTIDLNAENVFTADLTVDKAKILAQLLKDQEGGPFDDLAGEVSEAADEISDEKETTYIVITVTK